MLTCILAAILTLGQAAGPTIRFPDVVAPVPPAPAPLVNGDATVLKENFYYVIDSDIELFLRAQPSGIVSIESFAGPQSFPTKWLVDGGNAKTKFKQFTGKFIYVLEAVKDGTVDLLIIPKGVQTEKEILQRTIEAQIGARPPPKPDDPKPDDDPETARLAKLLNAAFAVDATPDKALKVKQLSVLYSNAAAPTGVTFEKTMVTWDDLLLALQNGRKAMMPDPVLVSVRRTLADYLNAKFPTQSGVALDGAARKVAATEFARAAKVLWELK